MSIADWSGPVGSPAWWSFWAGVFAAAFAIASAVPGGAAFFARQAASMLVKQPAGNLQNARSTWTARR
jgi:hypothetical protein